MKKLTLIYILLFSIAHAQVTINGKVANSIHENEVSLVRYTDYITFDFEELEKAPIMDQKFHITANIEHTGEYFLKIGNKISKIYLQPNQHYSLFFTSKSIDRTVRFTRNQVNVIFDSLPENDVNGLILELNGLMDYFYADNILYAKLNQSIFNAKLDSFIQSVDSTFSNFYQNDFFSFYVDYSLSELKILGGKGKNGVVRDLIKNKEILYHHPIYMRHFTKLYDDIVTSSSLNVNGLIDDLINESQDWKVINKLYQRDTIFPNQEIRELVFLIDFSKRYYSDKYNKEVIIDIIKQIRNNSDYQNIKDLSDKIIVKLTKMDAGQPAPNFILTNQKGKEINLEDFRGKYVYLVFWASWSKTAMSEMDLFPDFIDKYGENIEFVSINIDESKLEHEFFVASHRDYKWEMLHIGNKYDLLDEYNVSTIPSYYLIDPEGNFYVKNVATPTPNGEYETVDKTFFYIHKNHQKRRDFNIGRK